MYNTAPGDYFILSATLEQSVPPSLSSVSGISTQSAPDDSTCAYIWTQAACALNANFHVAD